MKLDEIRNLAKRDRAGRELSDRLTQDPSTDAVTGLAVIDGRLKDSRLAPLLDAAPDMSPARQRLQLGEGLAIYQNELTDGVLGNVNGVVRELGDNKSLAKYLLASPLKPAKYGGVSTDWLNQYTAAREAGIFLRDPEKEMPGRVNVYVREQVDSLKKDGVNSGLISGLIWVYRNQPQIAQEVVIADANKKIIEFTKGLTVAQGREYIADRVKTLKGKGQRDEAYRLGQSLSG